MERRKNTGNEEKEIIVICFDISCDICRESECFSLNTSKKKIYKTYHHIKKKDICPNCVTMGVINMNYIPLDVEVIIRDLTKDERKKVIEFYNL